MEQLSYHIREQSWLAKIAARKLRTRQVAMVLGKTIHLHGVSEENFLQDERWVKHELCHIKQFQQYGYFGFITKYLWESWKHGYYNNYFEVQAREAELL
ncbi:MAG: DUF4157 domain-containing protein [Bacteroidetes bacterium]|nr:DUF4157 domain-containing protein [Bacteroidota bacterium]